MNLGAIEGLGAHDEAGPVGIGSAAKAAHQSAGAGFGALVQQGLQSVSDQLMQGQEGLQALALGQAGSLHDVMIRMEEARVSFQLMLQVRNRLLEAYQEVMRMQL